MHPSLCTRFGMDRGQPDIITGPSFGFMLPVIHSGNITQFEPTKNSSHTMPKKVLIVEDQPDSRRLIVDILYHFNAQDTIILSARDGLEAYEMVQREKPDLILLDIMLPGMSGHELCEKIRANPETAKTHIIIISARYQTEDRQEAIRRGANEYLVKPFDVQALLGHVRKALDVMPISAPTPIPDTEQDTKDPKTHFFV